MAMGAGCRGRCRRHRVRWDHHLLCSFGLDHHFSVGLGGRYWALWTNNGQANRTTDDGAPITPTPPQAFRATVEQAGVFLQGAYRFGPDCF
jgi:hypothetical protein